MDILTENKILSIYSKFIVLNYALGYMQNNNIYDCTEVFELSEDLKKDFDVFLELL